MTGTATSATRCRRADKRLLRVPARVRDVRPPLWGRAYLSRAGDLLQRGVSAAGGERRKMKRLNRAQRTYRLLRRSWSTSMDIIREVGSVKPTNCVSEVRRVYPEFQVLKRRNPQGLCEYRMVEL